MIAQVKSNAYRSGKVNNRKDTLFSSVHVNPRYVCKAKILNLVAPNEVMLGVLEGLDNGNQLKVSKIIKMIFTTTLMGRINVQALEPQGVDEKLDLEHIEIQCQVHLP
jgi:hypothetical protein